MRGSTVHVHNYNNYKHTCTHLAIGPAPHPTPVAGPSGARPGGAVEESQRPDGDPGRGAMAAQAQRPTGRAPPTAGPAGGGQHQGVCVAMVTMDNCFFLEWITHLGIFLYKANPFAKIIIYTHLCFARLKPSVVKTTAASSENCRNSCRWPETTWVGRGRSLGGKGRSLVWPEAVRMN